MKRSYGFTLVEIMVVVAIIGLLAALAIPSFVRARREVQVKRFINDLRISYDAFVMFNVDNSGYPPDRSPGEMPDGMSVYLRKVKWDESTSIGGQWDWDYQQFGYLAGVSVYLPDRTVAEMQEVDARIDDGDLATGKFRSRPQGYIYILEF